METATRTQDCNLGLLFLLAAGEHSEQVAIQYQHGQVTYRELRGLVAGFAQRLRDEAGSDPARLLRRAFLLALGREPDADEVRWCMHLIGVQGLTSLCRVILNMNEFLFIP